MESSGSNRASSVFRSAIFASRDSRPRCAATSAPFVESAGSESAPSRASRLVISLRSCEVLESSSRSFSEPIAMVHASFRRCSIMFSFGFIWSIPLVETALRFWRARARRLKLFSSGAEHSGQHLPHTRAGERRATGARGLRRRSNFAPCRDRPYNPVADRRDRAFFGSKVQVTLSSSPLFRPQTPEHFPPGTFPPPAPPRTSLALFPCEGAAFWAPLHAGQCRSHHAPGMLIGTWSTSGLSPHSSHTRPEPRTRIQAAGPNSKPSPGRILPPRPVLAFPLMPPTPAAIPTPTGRRNADTHEPLADPLARPESPLHDHNETSQFVTLRRVHAVLFRRPRAMPHGHRFACGFTLSRMASSRSLRS